MKSSKIFWRSVFLSGVIFTCIVLLITGISVAYENIQSAFYANFVNALEITEDSVRILDFEFKK